LKVWGSVKEKKGRPEGRPFYFRGTAPPFRTLPRCECFPDENCPGKKVLEAKMFKGGLLWLVGIPLPIVLILWLMGYLS